MFGRLARHLIALLAGFALFAGFALLASCNFHLRGNLDLPPALARVYVSGADRDLVERVSDALAQSGAAVMDSAQGATRIHIGTSRFARAALTTDAEGRATTYSITYEIVFSVTGSNGDSLQSAQSISLQRAFEYAPARQLQTEQESRFLQTEMQREAALRILRQLARL